MELRWLEGEFKHGKFKLQYRDHLTSAAGSCGWVDVPHVKEEVHWCEHWVQFKDNFNKMRWKARQLFPWADYIPDYCPWCGAKRPNG